MSVHMSCLYTSFGMSLCTHMTRHVFCLTQIDHFFAFGSPMGLFVAMNEYESMVTKDHLSAESFLPSCVCKRIHNLHHPSDPIVSAIHMYKHTYMIRYIQRSVQ